MRQDVAQDVAQQRDLVRKMLRFSSVRCCSGGIDKLATISACLQGAWCQIAFLKHDARVPAHHICMHGVHVSPSSTSCRWAAAPEESQTPRFAASELLNIPIGNCWPVRFPCRRAIMLRICLSDPPPSHVSNKYIRRLLEDTKATRKVDCPRFLLHCRSIPPSRLPVNHGRDASKACAALRHIVWKFMCRFATDTKALETRNSAHSGGTVRQRGRSRRSAPAFSTWRRAQTLYLCTSRTLCTCVDVPPSCQTQNGVGTTAVSGTCTHRHSPAAGQATGSTALKLARYCCHPFENQRELSTP